MGFLLVQKGKIRAEVGSRFFTGVEAGEAGGAWGWDLDGRFW